MGTETRFVTPCSVRSPTALTSTVSPSFGRRPTSIGRVRVKVAARDPVVASIVHVPSSGSPAEPGDEDDDGPERATGAGSSPPNPCQNAYAVPPAATTTAATIPATHRLFRDMLIDPSEPWGSLR